MKHALLITAVSEGSESAFKVLFKTFYNDLVSYASLFLSIEDAEEVTQDLFISIWDNRRTLNITASVKSYLFQSVKNRALNHIRSTTTYRDKCMKLHQKYSEIVYRDSSHHMWDLKDIIGAEIDNLPENLKETFKLSRFTPLTNKQIADRLGIVEKTVESRITQALKILRERLKVLSLDI